MEPKAKNPADKIIEKEEVDPSILNDNNKQFTEEDKERSFKEGLEDNSDTEEK